MMRYMRALAKVVLKSPIPWIAVLICQLMLLAPFIRGDQSMGYFMGTEELQTRLFEAQKNMEAGVYDTMPPEVLERQREDISIMLRATTTDDPHEYARLRADLVENDLEAFDAGNLSGSTRMELESKHRFFTLLSEQADARIYLSYREMPALYYLASAYTTVPLIVWVLPAIMMTASLTRAVRGKTLLAQAPLGRVVSCAAQALVLVTLGIASIALIALVPFAVTLLANGLGEATYPIVNVLGESQVAIAEATVGHVVLRMLLMLSALAAFSVALAHAVSRIVPRRAAALGPVLACVLLAMPLVEAYLQMGSLAPEVAPQAPSPLADALAPYNPLTYIDECAQVAGYANYWPHQVLLHDERLTIGLACAVLVAWGLAVFALACGVAAARGARIARQDAIASAEKDAASLKAHGLRLAYGKRQLLGGADCAVRPGVIAGLIAPNGCGKTTLLEALAAVGGARRDGGVHAQDVSSADADFHKLVLYVPCDAGLLYPNLTAADHVKLASALWPDKVDTGKLIELCGLGAYLNRPVRTYSSGMKQQLALAVAYCTGVRYLLLDEPMNALDPTNVALNTYIMRRLAAQGTGILLSSHILSNLDDLCDEAWCICEGKLECVALGREASETRADEDSGVPGSIGLGAASGDPARRGRFWEIYERVFGTLSIDGTHNGRMRNASARPDGRGGA